MSEVRKVARENPEAVRSVAERVEGELGDRLIQILEEEADSE